MTLELSGKSLITPLAPAISTLSPIFKWPDIPDWPPILTFLPIRIFWPNFKLTNLFFPELFEYFA